MLTGETQSALAPQQQEWSSKQKLGEHVILVNIFQMNSFQYYGLEILTCFDPWNLPDLLSWYPCTCIPCSASESFSSITKKFWPQNLCTWLALYLGKVFDYLHHPPPQLPQSWWNETFPLRPSLHDISIVHHFHSTHQHLTHFLICLLSLACKSRNHDMLYSLHYIQYLGV